MEKLLATIREGFDRDGYYFPVDALSPEQALDYRKQFEAVEHEYKDKDPDFNALVYGYANMVMPFVDEITRLSSVLDPVRAILGPDVMVWGANLFIKEAHSPNYVSWHQDLTYWGLDNVDEVTAWVALSPATVRSGCMRYVPGTHTQEIVPHRDTFAEDNQLSRGQELAVDVNEAEAVDVVLAPGQIALHHGRIFHASSANQTDDRRIGLAIRYISPRMQQVSGVKTYCTLVSGEDRYGHFHLTEPPRGVMHPTDREMAHRAIEVAKNFLFAATC